MKILNVMKARRSVRKFKDTAIPDTILKEMLEAARLAPSPGNSQRYVFGVIKDQEIKEKLARAAGGQMWIASAPVVFACCADLSWDIAEQPEDDFGVIVNKLRFNNEFLNYISEYPDWKARVTLFENGTCLIPAEHIFLIAASYGMSACFVGFLDIEESNKILQLPEHISCFYLLPVGYADEMPGEKYLKNLDELVFYDHWN
jgi:nitroreductase